MPIKFQALGGGGLTELTIKTSSPNTTVTITKENYSNTLVSDDTCLVTCKLTNGTYQVTARSSDGKTAQKEIIIDDQEEVDLRITDQIKNLALGAKLKFSNGRTFYLKAKNVSGHEANSATFVSEFIIEDANCHTYSYKSSDVYLKVLPKYYNELNSVEKNAVIYRKYQYYYRYRYGDGGRYFDDKYGDVESYFYIMSDKELGSSGTSTGTNLGFTNSASRIMRYQNGKVGGYWTRDGYYDSYIGREYMGCVETTGAFESLYVNNNLQSGVVPSVDLKGDIKCALDIDGYWIITE